MDALSFRLNRDSILRIGSFIAPLYVSVFLFVCSPQPALADNHFDTIYFAEEAYWPPYTPNAYGIAKEGLSLELMQAIFSQLDLKVEIELVPQKRMLQYLREGKKDAVSVITKNPDRLKYLDYTDAIIPAERGLIYYLSNREAAFEWREFEDLRGLEIGLVSGASYGSRFNQAAIDLDLNLVKVSSTNHLFDMLLAKRIDILLCSERTANNILRNTRYGGKIAHASKTYDEKGFHIAFSKKSEARTIIPKVNEVIQKMTVNGSLEAIVNSY